MTIDDHLAYLWEDVDTFGGDHNDDEYFATLRAIKVHIEEQAQKINFLSADLANMRIDNDGHKAQLAMARKSTDHFKHEVEVTERALEIAVDMKVYHECSMANDACFNNEPPYLCGKDKCTIRLEYIDMATNQARDQIDKEVSDE